MKFYDFVGAPSPQRVRIFVAEKGLDLAVHQVDLRAGEQFESWYREINPRCTVPALALEDGAVLTESEAICRYLEVRHPQPALFGETALEQARVIESCRRLELEGYLAVADVLRNSAEHFKDRALPGPQPVAQIPALVERGKARLELFFKMLNQAMQGREFLAIDRLSLADIYAFVAVEFSRRIQMQPGAELQHLQQWLDRLRARPAFQA